MREPLSTEVFSEVVAAIYDCAVEPGQWRRTLELLRRALDCVLGNIALQALPSGDPLLTVWTGTDRIWIDRTAQYSADIVELWGGSEKMLSYPLDQPAILSRLTGRAEREANRFYLEWAKPQGLCDQMAIIVARDATMLASIAVGRHESAGLLGDLEVDTARLLIPHLQRAVAIGRLLDIKSVVTSMFEATLDTLSVAVVLTDANLRVVHANEAAHTIFATPEVPINTKRGTLTVHPSAVEVALRAAVQQAAKSEMGLGRRGLGIPASANTATPWLLHVLPLREGQIRPGLAPSAVAAIFIAPARAPLPAPTDALAAMFDLTPAEARVFAQIASGRTRREAGMALGIGEPTVKTHLSQIFLKTGTRRQADLVALNASIGLPVVGASASSGAGR